MSDPEADRVIYVYRRPDGTRWWTLSYMEALEHVTGGLPDADDDPDIGIMAPRAERSQLLTDGGVRSGDTTSPDQPFCDVQARSAAFVFEEPDGSEAVELAEEGYQCPDFASVRVRIETHASGEMEFDACTQHAQQWRDEGVVVAEVESYE